MARRRARGLKILGASIAKASKQVTYTYTPTIHHSAYNFQRRLPLRKGRRGKRRRESREEKKRRIYIRRATFLARSLQGITISISTVLSIQGNYGNFEYSLILLLH